MRIGSLLSVLTVLCLGGRVGLANTIAQTQGPVTIDTFSVSQTNWLFGQEPPNPLSGTLTGSFSGIVEPSGLIEQGDLTAFSLTYRDQFNSIPFVLSELSLFSFDTKGGVSSLDIAAQQSYVFCEGAAAVLDPACFGVFRPQTVAAEVVLGGDTSAYTLDAPTIQLVSSVTTTPLTTPEPGSLLLSVLGLLTITTCMLFARGRKWATESATPSIGLGASETDDD